MKSINRRNILLGSMALGLSSCVTDKHKKMAETTANSDIEVANEKLVNDFCRDWATGDVNVLAEYFTEDVIYQLVENTPLINGKEEFKQKVAPFLNNFNQVRWDILRSCAMGRLVVNDRIDYYEDPIKGESQIFAVTGIFVVENNKIKDWRDWTLPNSE